MCTECFLSVHLITIVQCMQTPTDGANCFLKKFLEVPLAITCGWSLGFLSLHNLIGRANEKDFKRQFYVAVEVMFCHFLKHDVWESMRFIGQCRTMQKLKFRKMDKSVIEKTTFGCCYNKNPQHSQTWLHYLGYT